MNKSSDPFGAECPGLSLPHSQEPAVASPLCLVPLIRFAGEPRVLCARGLGEPTGGTDSAMGACTGASPKRAGLVAYGCEWGALPQTWDACSGF